MYYSCIRVSGYPDFEARNVMFKYLDTKDQDCFNIRTDVEACINNCSVSADLLGIRTRFDIRTFCHQDTKFVSISGVFTSLGAGTFTLI